jgi:hypothetical protein
MSAADTIQVHCACGKKLKAPASAAGKKGKCPCCGATIVLAAAGTNGPAGETFGTEAPALPRSATASGASPRTRPAAAAPQPPADDDLTSAMYDLAREADTAPQVDNSPRCPQCVSPMAAGAVLCVRCGFDTRTGKKISAAPAAPAAAKPPLLPYGGSSQKKKPVDRMAAEGSLVAGILVSALFAVGASVLWFLVAWATGFSIGWIAIIIGGAAGLGMQIGQKGYSAPGGIAAAAMTLMAILLAKFALLQFVYLPKIAPLHPGIGVFDLRPAALGLYFFSPIGTIIMFVGMGAAFRTANGSVTD